MTGLLTAYDLPALRERRSVKWREHPADVLPMRIAEMDTPLAEPIAAALRAAVTRGDTGYATTGRFAEAFAGFAARRYGWRPDPGAMRLVPDIMAGIVEILHLTTSPGDRVVINTPAYPPYFHWLERTGRQVVHSPFAPGPRLDLERLERDFAGARAYLLCNPHNPTGLALGRDDLLAVAELADRHGVRVISDEIHAPLTYPGATHIPFASLDTPAAARSIVLASASKAWNLAGLKAALAVPGDDARADAAAIDEELAEGAGLFGVIASEAAFAHGDAWLDTLVTELDANRHRLAALLRAHLPDIGFQIPQAGYLAWLDCRPLGLGDDPAAVFLRRARLALASGPRYGPPGRGHARLNFAAAPDLLTQAVDLMKTAVTGGRSRAGR